MLERLFRRAKPATEQVASPTASKDNKPEPRRAPVIEKDPPRPHIGIDTKLTSEWWQKGTIRPGDFEYAAKVMFEPGDGIDGSEVRKLELRDRDGKPIAHFDGEWDMGPQPGSPEEKAVRQIVAFYRDNARDMPYQDWPLENVRSDMIEDAERSDNPMEFFQKKDQAAASRPDLASVKLVDPASFKNRPGASQDEPAKKEPAKEAKGRLHGLQIDAATTVGRNRHEAGGYIYSHGSDDRYAVQLEWHEIHGQGADGKASLLLLHVQSFRDDKPVIHYEGGWIVRPATDEARDILEVIKDEYGPLPEKGHESDHTGQADNSSAAEFFEQTGLTPEEWTARVQAKQEASHGKEPQDLSNDLEDGREL